MVERVHARRRLVELLLAELGVEERLEAFVELERRTRRRLLLWLWLLLRGQQHGRQIVRFVGVRVRATATEGHLHALEYVGVQVEKARRVV